MRRAITNAIEAGALVEARKGAFATQAAWKPAMRRTVAVELKLADWKRALRQASLYRDWAGAAWVLLATAPTEAAGPAATALGVGLAVLQCDGGLQIIAKPKPRRLKSDWASVWAGEQILFQAVAAAASQVGQPDRQVGSRGLELACDSGGRRHRVPHIVATRA